MLAATFLLYSSASLKALVFEQRFQASGINWTRQTGSGLPSSGHGFEQS